MDNLAVHKVTGVEEAIHTVDAELWYLPAALFTRSQSDRDGVGEDEGRHPIAQTTHIPPACS